MYEIMQQIGPYISIIMAKTKDGARPLRWDGRDFIKVFYNPPDLNPPIYQTFYRSTGLHILAAGASIDDEDTTDVWTPTDGIVRNKDDISKTYIAKVDHIGYEFAYKYAIDPKSGKPKKIDKGGDSCDRDQNGNSILCRFGNCNLVKISVLISKTDNRFWNSEKGIFIKKICGIDLGQTSYGDNIDIKKGIALDNYINIDKFIGQAISFNHVDDPKYKSPREKQMNGKLLWGPYDLNDCIVKHPTLGDTIFEGVPQQHCKYNAETFSKKFMKDLKIPEQLSLTHQEDIIKSKSILFDDMDFPQSYNTEIYPNIIADTEDSGAAGGAAGEDVEMQDTLNVTELTPDFRENCHKYDIDTLIGIAKRLEIQIYDKNRKQVHRTILCNRIIKKINL